MSFCDTFYQAFTSYYWRSAIFWGVGIWCLTMFQTCSIGEKSGDSSGHGGVLTAHKNSPELRKRYYLVGS
ncbi:hypothetical protein TNCV_269341 [Trichonephila clavipes]|nr:hypothetical protein TNCV_269341 [Trichonephila clavipes]